MSLRRDRRAILTVLGDHAPMPATFSQILLEAGENLHGALDSLIRDGKIEACFPEAKPGDSGRQFWRLVTPSAPAIPPAGGDDCGGAETRAPGFIPGDAA